MNRFWELAVSLVLIGAPVQAGVIITLDQVTLFGAPGQTLSFTGSLVNTTNDELFLTSANLNTAPELSGDPSPFFIGGIMALSPSFSLLGLQTTPSFGLFDIFIPLGTLPGIYAVNNDFRLLGGLSDTDQLDLANVGFTVVATPEPGSLVTLVAGLGAIAALRRIRPLASTAPNGCQ